MKLTITKRIGKAKSELGRIRREGNIPAVVYGLGQPIETIVVNGVEFQAILRGLKKGRIATTSFELEFEGKARKALIKEIQYHPTTYVVEHLDFLLLSDEVPVTVKVPIEVIGAADCSGIKLGGFLRFVIRAIKVSCLPKDIPQEFPVDIRTMNIADAKRLADIPLPPTVRPLMKMNEVAIAIAKR